MTSKSLSPLSKDPSTIGKLINKQQHSSIIEQQSQTHDLSIRDIPNPQHTEYKNIATSIGINTSRLNMIAHNGNEQIKPVTQFQKAHEFKVESGVCKIDLISKRKHSNKKLNVSSEKIDKWARKSGFFRSGLKNNQRKSQRSPVGSIVHQKSSLHSTRSAPKETATSPQLPSLNKIQTNLRGFKSFLGETQVSPFSVTTNSYLMQPVTKQMGVSNHSRMMVEKKNDPDEQEKLNHPRKGFRSSRAMKITSFADQKTKQYEVQTFAEPRQLSPVHQSGIISKKMNGFQSQSSEQEQLGSQIFQQQQNSHEFIYSPSASPYSFKVDLRTPISRIKQLLIQSTDILHASFMIPQIFFHPPSHDASPKQLHYLMLEVFKFIDMTPQIVTIKKYVNCVVMCDKNLCILWSYNGKVYFGGWDRILLNQSGLNSSQSRVLSQGSKDGIGLEWIPSRYIYYGEFKNNKKQGYGIMKKANKELYLGQWKSNQREGWGKVYNLLGEMVQDGQFIEGCFIRDREKGR